MKKKPKQQEQMTSEELQKTFLRIVNYIDRLVPAAMHPSDRLVLGRFIISHAQGLLHD